MSWPWSSPQATRQGLRDRLGSRYPAAEIQLRMYEVAFRRLLVRLEAADPSRWVVKGGVALLLRLDPNRTCDDIDLTYVDAAGEHANAVEALERGFAVTLEEDDFFSFEFAAPPVLADRVDDDTFVVRALALSTEQREAWRRTWAKATRRAPPISFDDALAVTVAFLDPILADHAHGVWTPQTRRWPDA